jgi:peptide/nickel transport system substrate-binding protein
LNLRHLKKSLVVLFAFALVASACSPKSGTSSTSTTASPNASAGAAATAGKPADPNKPFVFVSQSDVSTIDPVKVVDEVSLGATINFYDPLVAPKVSEGSMEPGPHLAEKWEVSADAKTYTFTIRKGVKFQSGNPLTPQDIVFSMQRILALKQGNSWLWSDVLPPENVKAVNDNTVTFNLTKPHAPFVASLTQFYIVDSVELKKHLEKGDFGDLGDYGQKYLETNVVGSGPYKLAKWERGSRIEFTQFADYWKGWKDNQIKNLRWQNVSEEATVKTMIASGEADMVHQWLSVKSYNDIKKMEGITVKEDTGASLYVLPMNTSKAPLDDINVRQAISYAFNYETAVKDILAGAKQAKGPVAANIPGHNPDVTQYTHDVAKAKDLLAKSKYAGKPIEVEYMFIGDFPAHRQIGALLQQSLQEIGITVKLNASTWPNIMQATTKKETTPNMFIVEVGLRYPHVDNHTFGMYHPSSWGNYRGASWYNNTEVAALLDKARNSANVDEQMNAYKQAQKLIVDDAPGVFISNPTHRVAYKNYVEGYKYVGILGNDLNFYNLTLKK